MLNPFLSRLISIFILGALSLVPGGDNHPLQVIPICAIQGQGFSSPYKNQTVRVQGVVYADLDETSRKGFFMQTEGCDGDALTSDGLFVYFGDKMNLVSPGDLVEVEGVVWEYYGLTEVYTSSAGITVLSSGHTLPMPVSLNPPWDNAQARAYFESLEGMAVALTDGVVVGPTNSDERSWVVNAELGVERVFWDDPMGTGELICVDDGGLFQIDPQVGTGDIVHGLYGAMDFRLGDYCLQPLLPPVVQPSSNYSGAVPAGELSIATFNMANLFDTIDDPEKEDERIGPTEYQRRLKKRAMAIHESLGEPDILAVQEVENITVTLDLLAREEIQAPYAAYLEEGPDSRGLDVALLYRTDRVRLLDAQSRQGCTSLVDGLGPDGNLDVQNPHNDLTCDLDGDGVLDGNRLFSRPPLVAHMEICQPNCALQARFSKASAEDTSALWLIITHLKSKVQDTDQVAYTLPRRIEQARFVAALVDEIRVEYLLAQVVVLGDMNDHPDSQPLAVLESASLFNLMLSVERQSRYTYIYRGVSQVLDHVLFTATPGYIVQEVTPMHINADFPYTFWGDANTVHRSSDHDPVLVIFAWQDFSAILYLPFVAR